jgi:hypothetical protein
MKSFRRTGTSTPAAMSERSVADPPNLWGSVSTEIAAAPARAYSLALDTAFNEGLMSPLEGDLRFISAITATVDRRSDSRNDGPGTAASARARHTLSLSDWAAARA